MTEPADGARLLSECGGYTPPRVRIPLSPPYLPDTATWAKPAAFLGWQVFCFPGRTPSATGSEHGTSQELTMDRRFYLAGNNTRINEKIDNNVK